jgi:hypothetical protein
LQNEELSVSFLRKWKEKIFSQLRRSQEILESAVRVFGKGGEFWKFLL